MAAPEGTTVEPAGFRNIEGENVPVFNITDHEVVPTGHVILKTPSKELLFSLVPASETWLERLQREYVELSRKVQKLETFLDTGPFNALDRVEQEALRAQHKVMVKYMEILFARVNRVMAKN